MEFLYRQLRGESLKGKVALLTGAGGGIGARIAVALAAEGCNLCLSDVNTGALSRARDAATQRGAGAVRVVCVPADLRQPAEVARLAKACEDAYARCDYLLNVAGCVSVVDFATESADEAAMILQVNLHAPTLLTRALLPGMLARRSGVIVNMTSLLGFVVAPRLAAYCASKSGMNAWALALRGELRGSGVRVCNVSPLFVTDTATGTGMYEQMLLDLQRAGAKGKGKGPQKSDDLALPPTPLVPALHPALWEVSAHDVTRRVLGALRRGAPAAIVETTALPQRLLGAAQLMAPDWFTAWLCSQFCPGDAYFVARSAQPLAAAARKEE